MKARYALIAIAVALSAANAHAQWKWRDAGGRVHYSDQPPPVSVPITSILRGGAMAPIQADAKPSDAAPLASVQTPVAAKTTPAARPVPGAGAEPAGDAKPKEGAMRPATPIDLSAAQLEQLAQACTQLRAEVRTLESGMRVARVNARGEQEIMTDEDRAKRAEFVHREITSNCPQS